MLDGESSSLFTAGELGCVCLDQTVALLGQTQLRLVLTASLVEFVQVDREHQSGLLKLLLLLALCNPVCLSLVLLVTQLLEEFVEGCPLGGPVGQKFRNTLLNALRNCGLAVRSRVLSGGSHFQKSSRLT